MTSKFEALVKLGAGDFEHLDGSLIEHLNGTKELLKKWQADPELQDAGLYHAAYGTAGFTQNLVSTDQRAKIASLIGESAEDIVYQYCACDRKEFFPRIGQDESPLFPNRFTGESYYLSGKMLRYFCELTAANETEIALDNTEFVAKYGPSLARLFTRMKPFLSFSAREKVIEVFGASNA